MSFNLSRKKSLKYEEGCETKSTFSLPKLGQRKTDIPFDQGNEIMKSELGWFDIYKVLKVK